ncbi:PIN domain-containing protein [Conexibacter sp. SYSU D00693]|uniref:PIN domain-containing protein n=1 Tax=Conexibacter sp. SYSU D00693 TaxID=2812560 RepID=UPI00196B37CA|nr:PIN domain-containing protein [Conexibacter sp. SYSU D00693]
MAVVVDTSYLLALANAGDDHHEAARDWLAVADDDLVTSPLVVAQVEAVLHRLGGPAAAEAFWEDLDAGAYVVRWWADALTESIAIARAGREVVVDLVEASLVAVAARARTRHIATFRTEALRRLTTAQGEPFVLHPTDT